MTDDEFSGGMGCLGLLLILGGVIALGIAWPIICIGVGILLVLLVARS